MLVIACANCGVTVCPALCAAAGTAVAMATAAQVAAMMVRIFMGFVLLPTGWSLFFIVSSGLAGLPITDTERVSKRSPGERSDTRGLRCASCPERRGVYHRARI